MSNGSIARSIRASSARRAIAARRATPPATRRRPARDRTSDARESRNPGASSGRPSRRAASLKLAAAKYSRLEPLEQRRIVHRRVERRDQPFGRVQLGERRALVVARAPRRARGPATCARAGRRSRRMPSSVSGKPVESSGSITPAADGSSAHAGPATRALRNARRGAWTNGSTARAAELIRDRRQRREQAIPGRRAVGARRSPRRRGSVSAAPALVMPLLNRSTQIQPPGNTWCTAASSIG